MSNVEPTQSEVTRLLALIDTEYQSAQLGLSGLALGTSMHAFITAKLEHIEMAREELSQLVGEDESARLVIEQMNKSGEENRP